MSGDETEGRFEMQALTRRGFLWALSASGAMLAAHPQSANPSPPPSAPTVKPISGSWFEFQHPSKVEGAAWNAACASFTGEHWDAKIREIAQVGMEYLVLMGTALDNRSFVPTTIFPQWHLACPDPLEAVLAAADKYGVKFFIGAGFYGNWGGPKAISDPVAAKKRVRAIEEITRSYSHHRSFHGWYWPDEVKILPRFSAPFVQYVNTSSRLARQLTPHARILIAPYGTRLAVPDDEYVRQLEALDVDFVAYQDEVGVRKSTVEETPRFYEGLRKAHDRARRSAIWADVEIFRCEGEVYKSALLPAPFSRVLRQMEAVSPWVDKILVYQYQGMMNQPGSAAFCGTPESTKLYTAYVNWLGTQEQGTRRS